MFPVAIPVVPDASMLEALRREKDVGEKPCECSTWCRAEVQSLHDKHHKNCPEYTKLIRVVKITHGGSSYCDSDINTALLSLAEGGDYTYQVQFLEMMQGEYDGLPEFEGF